MLFSSLLLPPLIDLRRMLAALFVCLLLGVVAQPAAAQFALPEAPAAAPVQTVDPDTQALIELLENDAARERLIERLRGGAPAVIEEAATPMPFARQVAEHTRALAAQVSGVFLLAGSFADVVSSLWQDTTQANVEVIARTIGNLVLVVFLTLSIFWTLRLGTHKLRQRFNAQAEISRLPRRLLLILAAIGVDVIPVLLAWVVGNAFSVNLANDRITGLNQSLFLNAFLVAEGIKVVSRAVLMPRKDGLRLLPVTDTTASYWNFWIERIVGLIAYAFLFVAPIAAWNVSPAVGEAVRVIAVFSACTIGIVVALQNKAQVRALLLRRVSNGHTDALARFMQGLARFWHVIAVVYFVAFFLVWIAQPRSALTFMVGATVETVIAIAVGILIVTFISRMISGGMRLTPDVKQRLPLLESRLNAFVPKVLLVVRFVVLLGVVIAVANAWDLFDFFAWASSGAGFAITTSLLSAALILLGGIAIYIVVSSWIEYRLNPEFGTVPTARERTLLALLRNAFTVTLCVVIAIMVLSELGVNVGPLLAGAGVLGLAVGFGAQKMVQDVITGVFIQLENAMNEGDVVTAGGISGVVERLTIRSVSMRDLNGVYHVIPFSSVDMVSNMMRNFSYHVADIGVAYRENIVDVKNAMHEAFDRLAAMEDHAPNIIGPFEMMGVNAFEDSAVIVRGRIKTLPGKQWATGRAYNEIIKEIFDERGIEIPFPHMTLYAGEDKQGKSPAFRVLNTREPKAGGSGEASRVEAESEAQDPRQLEAADSHAASEAEKVEKTEVALSDLAQDVPEESGRKQS
jgi:moderate conductance mechanosensitive channel